MHICQTPSPKSPLRLPLYATIWHHDGRTVPTHREESETQREKSVSLREGPTKVMGVGHRRTPGHLGARENKAYTFNAETQYMQSPALSRP